MRVDVRRSAELQATILTLKSVDRDIAKQLRAQSKKVIEPVFQKTLAEHAETKLEVLALAQTGRAAVSDQNVTLRVARVRGRKFSGGFDPRQHAKAVEFGMRPKPVEYQRRSRKGGTHPVKRTVGTQFRAPKRTGRVFFPTVAVIAPRILSLWVQTAVRTLHEAVEGRRG